MNPLLLGPLGLSPLTRGNPESNVKKRLGYGPIPAHAGEPSRVRGRLIGSGAYPRSRGGTSNAASPISNVRGLSPLTRGNLVIDGDTVKMRGPIPAHAGEPTDCMIACTRPGAYPRSRGGTFRRCSWQLVDSGLSPLTRGNRWLSAQCRYRHGPIPAHAGEPLPD